MQQSAQYFGRIGQNIAQNPSLLWQVATSTCVLDDVQDTLDVAGMTPLLGMPLDVLNASISAMRGNHADAMLRLAFALPGVGDVAGGAVLAARMGGRVVREGGEGAIKEVRLIGFRGVGLTSAPETYAGEHYLINAGHVGISVDGGMNIAGFHPSPEAIRQIEALHAIGQAPSLIDFSSPVPQHAVCYRMTRLYSDVPQS